MPAKAKPPRRRASSNHPEGKPEQRVDDAVVPSGSRERSAARDPSSSSRPAGSLAREQAREQARLAQRGRLALALIDSIDAHGYRATRVADVIAGAGVSRKTFYENFENKQQLLLWTFDAIAAELSRRIDDAYRESEGWPDRVEAAIRALVSSAIENPGALRLSVLEIAAVGPAGIERRERSTERYMRFLHDALSLAPGEGTVSDTILKALIGGFNRVLYRRVQGDDAATLLAVVPDLSTWAASYYPTPAAMLAEPKRLSRVERATIALDGGRAPGTLAPHPPLGGRRGLPRGDQNVSHSFVVESQRARILDAVANLVASEGYAGLKVEDIAERAAVSLVAFYEHYADKEDALLVAYEIGLGKLLASVELAYAAEQDWRLAIRAGIGALFRFLATERSFAHIALLDGLIATQRTAERSHYGVSAIARLLVPSAEQTGGIVPAAVTVEAIAGGMFELGLNYALAGRLADLPELAPSATYFALAPFLGGEEAALVAAGRPPAPLP